MQPSDAYSKIKVILNPIKIPSLPRSQHKITETENISTPFTCSSFFFLLQKNYLPFFHLTPSNIQSLHPSIRKFTSINFHLGGKSFRSSSNSNSLLLASQKNKLHSFLPCSIVDSDETTPRATTRDKQRSFSLRKLSV